MLRQPATAETVRVQTQRRGAFLVLAFFCLAACLIFVAFTVDVGYLSLTKTRMQNAVDAAALAAVQEITNAVQTAPPGVEDITQYAENQARQIAAQVAGLNGIYVSPQNDVQLGSRRALNGGGFETVWDAAPYNVVKVTARRDNDEAGSPDGKLRLFFAGITGDRYARVQTEAIAYIEARDMVVVHDFSRSMNFDSHFSNEVSVALPSNQIVNNLKMIWDDLQPLNAGSLEFEPQYLTLSDTTEGITSSVTFRFDQLGVSTSATLKQVRIRYNNNTEATFSNVSGKSANITGTRDITRAWVTATQNNPAQTMSENGITVSFPSGRKSAGIDVSPNRLRNLDVTFADGTTASQSWSGSTGPTSHTYTSSKEITSVRIRRTGSSTYTTFNPTPAVSEVVQEFVDSNANVMAAFGLNAIPYPYPSGSWNEFIDHCRTYAPFATHGYREMYGGLTFANYLLRLRSSHAETPALSLTRHYPFHAIKEGHELFCQFIEELGFDDHLGMVSYDTNHRVETQTNNSLPGIPKVNISSKPITNDYAAVINLMKYKQANHYSPATNMGGGMSSAMTLLDGHSRPGTRPTILLMTDGNTNTIDPGVNTSLPSEWNWNALLDYNGDGVADYTTTSSQKRYCLKLAYEAAQKGYTIHTMSVGADGDRELMRAIAHIGRGHYINVPGGVSVSEMEADLREAFHKIASAVPPAKLLANADSE